MSCWQKTKPNENTILLIKNYSYLDHIWPLPYAAENDKKAQYNSEQQEDTSYIIQIYNTLLCM